MKATGHWTDKRDNNLIDGGAHFYDTYECADGKWLSIGAIEPQFHVLLVKGLGLEADAFPAQMSRADWPAYSKRVAEVVKTKSREEWMKVFEGTDACVAPVLSMDEAPKHAHHAERKTFVEAFGAIQPGPAPRFSRTAGAIGGAPAMPGQQSQDVLRAWGIDAERAAGFLKAAAVVQA